MVKGGGPWGDGKDAIGRTIRLADLEWLGLLLLKVLLYILGGELSIDGQQRLEGPRAGPRDLNRQGREGWRDGRPV